MVLLRPAELAGIIGGSLFVGRSDSDGGIGAWRAAPLTEDYLTLPARACFRSMARLPGQPQTPGPFAYRLLLAFLPASAYVAAAITHFVSFEVGNLIKTL
jgi:hypothetical protein